MGFMIHSAAPALQSSESPVYAFSCIHLQPLASTHCTLCYPQTSVRPFAVLISTLQPCVPSAILCVL